MGMTGAQIVAGNGQACFFRLEGFRNDCAAFSMLSVTLCIEKKSCREKPNTEYTEKTEDTEKEKMPEENLWREAFPRITSHASSS